jgi:hypothetical protein
MLISNAFCATKAEVIAQVFCIFDLDLKLLSRRKDIRTGYDLMPAEDLREQNTVLHMSWSGLF